MSNALGTEGPVGTPAQQLGHRLRSRSPEIEARLLGRILELYELPPGERTELIAGAQVAVRDVVAYSIAAFEAGEGWSEPMPPSFGIQARFAVRIGMPLEDLLRGYSAGNTVIAEFVAQEVQDHPHPEVLVSGVGVQSRVADALITGLSTEYASELTRQPRRSVSIATRSGAGCAGSRRSSRARWTKDAPSSKWPCASTSSGRRASRGRLPRAVLQHRGSPGAGRCPALGHHEPLPRR